MIIFYNKKTGEIYGSVSGRVHSDSDQKTLLIKPENVADEDVGRFVAPFKPVIKTITEPIKELRIVNEKTRKVDLVDTGKTRKIKKADGYISTGKHASFIDKFEKDSSFIFKHTVKVDKNGEVSDFIAK